MPAFLSHAWIDDLGRAVRDADDLLDTIEHPIVIGYRVIGVPAVDEQADDEQAVDEQADDEQAVDEQADDEQAVERSYHIRLTPDGCSVGPGTDEADVVFETDHATAIAIATGDLRAQRAFMAGRLRAVGDVRVLLGNAAMVARLAELRPPIGA